MSATGTQLAAPTRAQQRIVRRAVARQTKAERTATNQAKNAAIQEANDERIAPAIQRIGTSTKAPRLVRDGISFRVASPIGVMVQMGRKREKNGGDPTIGERHGKAADRLMRAWEVSQTICIGTSKYGEAVSGSVESGVMSQTVLANVNRQQDALAEVRGARMTLGPLWNVVEAIALNGQDCKAWAESVGMQDKAALGYLRAGLDVLVGYYQQRDKAGRSG